MNINLIFKIILSALPIIITLIFIILKKNKTLTDINKMKAIINKTNKSIDEKTISKFVLKKQDIQYRNSLEAFVHNINTQLNLLGIQSKVETLLISSLILFLVGFGGSFLLIGAGPLLMIYMGVVCSALVFLSAKRKMISRKKELQQEFMEKLRDIASYMSVGRNLTTSISETLNSSKCSFVMKREFEAIKRQIYTGSKISDTFYKMYDNLGIIQIKEFAQAISIFESTGGNLQHIINNYQQSYIEQETITNTREVFVQEMLSSQKIEIAFPVLTIIVFGLINPSTFKGYYGSIQGQLIGIILVTMMITGIWLSNKIALRGIDYE